MRDPELLNQFANDRLSHRQIDELIGLARGLCADGVLNQAEVEFLQGWLAANNGVADNPVVSTLYSRVEACLGDGFVDASEQADLFGALSQFSANTHEVGELLKATSLPLCSPPPQVGFEGYHFCFTGIFSFGARSECAKAVGERGGTSGSLSKSTDFLVIGVYATESWKHSSFGNKIIKASAMRDEGVPIAIIGEEHWARHL